MAIKISGSTIIDDSRHLASVGVITATSLDISGDADIDGTLEADAITVNGSTLASVIEGTTVTNASHVLVTDNESTNENNLITFVEDATSSTGNVGLEMDGNLTYNPSTGTVTATQFAGGGGNLTGLTGASANTYGDASNVAQIVVNSDGKITAISEVAISGGGGGGGASGVWETNTTGINTSTNVGIGTTTVLDATLVVDVGTASTAVVVQGSEGRLFSVTNSLSSGSIFSVNDISGIPSIDVDADGTIQLAPYSTSENVGLGITNPSSKLHVVGGANITGVLTTGKIADSGGSVGTAASVLSSTGSGLSWVAQSGGASVANQADNRLISATGTTDALNAEANLTFDGTTLTISGDATFTGDAANVTWDKSTDDLIFNDGAKAIFGTSSDGVEIYHESDESYIKDSGTGKLNILASVLSIANPANNSTLIYASGSTGVVKLYHANSVKLKTTSTGIVATGIVTATSFSGDGGGLTGVTATGTGVVIKHDDSAVGTAATINFSTNLDVTDISAGVCTITASGGGGGGTTDMLEIMLFA